MGGSVGLALLATVATQHTAALAGDVSHARGADRGLPPRVRARRGDRAGRARWSARSVLSRAELLDQLEPDLAAGRERRDRVAQARERHLADDRDRRRVEEVGDLGAGDRRADRARRAPRRRGSGSCRARRGRRTSRRRCRTSAMSTTRGSARRPPRVLVVWPTAATCGSVKITRGASGPSAPCSTALSLPSTWSAGDRGLVLGHVRERRAAVEVADHVEPVVAGRRGSARRPRRSRRARARRSRARAPRPAACARPRRAARRRSRVAAVAERHRDLVAVAPRPRSPSGRCGCRRPAPRAPRVTCSQANSSSRGEQPPLALDQRDARAERAVGLAHLDADDAAAHDDQPVRDRLARSSPRGWSTGLASASPSIGGIAGVVPPARITARRTSIVSSPTTTRFSPSSRPQPRYSAIPRSSSHGSCELSSRSWMISSRRVEHRLHVELAVDRLGRAGDRGAPRRAARRAAAAPSTACRPRTSTRRRPCGPRRSRPRARPRPAARPPPRRRARRRSPPRRSCASFSFAGDGLQYGGKKPLGTTGFDVVGSWGWLRVEVPEAS